MGWLWWIGLALALGVIELLTVDLTFLMLAGGAAAAGVAGALGAPLWVQLVVGVVVAVLLMVLVRPMAVQRLRASSARFRASAAPAASSRPSSGLRTLAGKPCSHAQNPTAVLLSWRAPDAVTLNTHPAHHRAAF